MADFRRPPEWDQGADRHSTLRDPVLTVRQLTRFEYRKHYTRIDNALVFTTGRGGFDAYLPPRRPTRSEVAAKRYTAVYEVDMGVHRDAVSLRLPSDNDAFDFSGELELSWQVVRPELFVASGERDVPALLTRRLEELVRPRSRSFPIDHGSAAERAALDAVEKAGPLGGDIGLRVDLTLRLRVDDEAITHQQALRQTRYADERLGPAHELAMREDRLQAERVAARARQEHELAMLQGRAEIERQSLEAQKIAYYQHYLQHGGVAAWALHLSQHPEDSRLVMENLRQDQLALIRSQMGVAMEVLKGEGLEDYQRESINKYAVDIVEEVLTRNLPGAGPTPPAPGGLPWEGSHGGAADRPPADQDAPAAEQP
ncbi:hypothetical protein GA0115240_164526 [Streptomyces sp. DvalAA-14]|uniref:PE-PGRS family protein n=1 Tax=unclassified Streptomyces TaxID=2593676 RepID=UPI00081AFCC3|nr:MULTISPECIES: PE-PGRS family protein [unclassified Streptomyces]SCE46610.1 hypothetical protein GA0115240_164526 [Streptomyces sp. DvalAA-14]